MEIKMKMIRCHKSQVAWMGTFLDGEDFTEADELTGSFGANKF